MTERLVNVYRGGRLESFHSGSAAVVDAAGRLLAFLGDPSLTTFLRSAAKPFQCLPMLLAGAGEEFDLTGEEIALICASHGGEPHHVAAAAALLRKGDFDESDLLCGAHAPLEERSAADLRASGEEPSPLHNNCSGKHAGMLLTSKLLDASTQAYLEPDHPLQQQILGALAEFASVDPDDIPLGVDGCGVPSFNLSLYRAALAYARLAATATGAAHGIPRYAPAAREIVDSMTTYPDFVAGAWSMTTPLMESFERQLLAKEGAEGFYAMAILPPLTSPLVERFALAPDAPVGIALKINDGSMDRGRNPAILHLLEELGLDPASRPLLAPFRAPLVRNVAGREVGEIRAEFTLKTP